MEPVAILEQAFRIGYNKRFNEVWEASFSLPMDDPKNDECTPFNFVEIEDNGEYIGKFRIIPSLTVKDDGGNVVTYRLEHVLATLVDDIMFQYHQTTNLTTADNIQYILDQQTTQHWQLGTCEFVRYFHYKWENENGLLGPLFSIPKPFDVPYEWTFDTQSYPWTLNLVSPATERTCEIRYAKNMKSIEREVDPTDIINRIYPLGYGEGVNQLTIKEVNGGVSYLEDATSIGKYGVKAMVWTDKRFENADTLKASAQAILNERSVPKVIYRVSAIDLHKLTGEPVDKLTEGAVVRIVDPDFGTFEARIVSEAKSDITGAPDDIQLEIANKTEDLGTTQADMQRRIQINELYAQGATNLDSHDYNDNADSTHPAVIRFFIPEEMERINKTLMAYSTDKFRAYSQATEGGGATTVTSASGGGTTATSSNGGGATVTSASGGSSVQTSDSVSFNGSTMYTEKIVTGVTYENHIHALILDNTLDHNHDVSIPSHTHSVSVPSHSHSVTIPDHSHDISLPDHTHAIKYGIYETANAPTSVTIKVDGNTVPITATSHDDVDLIPYLAKDTSGKVTRGAWHEVTITPNTLGRVTANIVTQLFLQSRGGGNF